MNHVGQEFLAGAGFAGNQDGTRGRGNLVDRLEDFPHLGGVSQEAVQDLGFHKLVGGLVLLLGLDFLGNVFQLLHRSGFHQETVGAPCDSAGGAGPVLVVAEYKNLNARIFLFQEADHVHVGMRQQGNLYKR